MIDRRVPAEKKIKDYPDILTVRDVMAILRIGRASVYRLINENELPARIIAGKYKIPKIGVTSILRSIHESAGRVCYNDDNNNLDALPNEKECKL